MPPLLELQVQFSAIKPGNGLRQTMPGNVSEDRVVCPPGVGYLHFTTSNVHVGFTPDKMAIDLLSVALFKAQEFLGQHADEAYSLTVEQGQMLACS